ncbi:hypothetical protein L6164_029384 [Bauhinia variegata]|nr:hypothetical protein L6164_029384 [Bauhinia variegata]
MEWIDSFFNKGRELEHEAFLSAWLSMFVFPNNYLVNNAVFPIAINLARGNKIALAPALLASIYRDLDMLKESIVTLPKFQADYEEEYLPLDLSSPFWLVQIWAWERIQSLQPKPIVIHCGDPLMTKWQKAKPLNVRNVRLVLDSAGEEFNWRPYAILKHYSPIIYPENEMRVTLQETNLDEKQKLESFIICVRVSELVGRTVNSGKIYIPPRPFEADVTTRYLDWWKNSVMCHKDPFKDLVKGKRNPRSRKLVPQASEGNIAAHNGPDVPSGFPPEHSNMEISGYSEENDDASVPTGTVPKRMKFANDIYMAEEALRAKAAKVPVPEVPPGFPPRHNTGGSGNSVRESEPATFRENVEASMEGLEPAREGGNGSTKPRLTNERESPAIEGKERTNEPERKNFEFEDIAKLGERISRLETLFGSLLTEEDRTRS